MKFLKIVFFLFLFSGCSEKEETKTLTVGTCADNPPYEFLQNNQVVGIDIDIANEIAKRLEKKIIFQDLDMQGLLAALNSKTIDFGIAGLSVTPERRKYIDFSEHYLDNSTALLFLAKSEVGSIYDLKNKKIGVQIGTTWAELAKEFAKNLPCQLVLLNNNLLLIEELKNSGIDALLIEHEQAKIFAQKYQNIRFITLEQDNFFSIAMPKDSQLKKDINQILKDLKKEGIIEKIKEKWLNNCKNNTE